MQFIWPNKIPKYSTVVLPERLGLQSVGKRQVGHLQIIYHIRETVMQHFSTIHIAEESYR